jgi:hypothetical protein
MRGTSHSKLGLGRWRCFLRKYQVLVAAIDTMEGLRENLGAVDHNGLKPENPRPEKTKCKML